MAIATPTVTYCNLTTDLIRAYQNIYSFLQPKEITGWTLASGQASTYQSNATGYCSAVFQDGSPLASTTSIALVEASASTFYYDATNDKLYIHTSVGTDPDGNNTIEIGVDRTTFLTECRAIAQGRFESMLDMKFPRPLPESRYGASYLARKYDDDIIQAVAKLTCSIAISSFNPILIDANDLPSRLENEAKTIIDAHNDGSRKFSWEVTAKEPGSAEIMPYSVSGDGMIQIYGTYNGTTDVIMRIKIITGGATGTATYKYSLNDGSTYNDTAITTSAKWISVGSGTEFSSGINPFEITTGGLFLRFDDRGGSFTANDTWQLYAVRIGTEITTSRIGSVGLIG